ncbi:MAG: hypothetical protein EPO26_13360 [Chloroflexota bacterium]|nr:MAG: hypothetical protein EPO26_13360 [Chloroflexota bacterium]
MLLSRQRCDRAGLRQLRTDRFSGLIPDVRVVLAPSAPAWSPPWPTRILIACVLFVLAVLPASAAAPWLDDAAIANWNAAGAVIPRATTPDVPFQEICLRRERPATGSDEERSLAAAGWRLTEYWPSRRQGAVAVILATSMYDGMCRPYDYNGFVFLDGRYVGRLAPTHLVSRTDGAIDPGGATIASDGSIEARFIRYADRDPLCCPSRGHTRVTYRVVNGVLGVATRQSEGASPPATALPRTGGLTVPIGVGLAASLCAICGGALVRCRRRDQTRFS